MHELGICDALLKMLRNVAEEEKLQNVQSITVEVGTLSGVVPRFLSDCWQAVIDGTEFDAVDMIVETVEGEAQCIECGERFVADLERLRCPNCGGNKLTPVSGTDLTLKEILERRIDAATDTVISGGPVSKLPTKPCVPLVT